MQFFLQARVIVTILGCPFVTLAQQPPCTIKSPPSLRGFQLGMSVAQVRSRLDDATMLDAAAASTQDADGPRKRRAPAPSMQKSGAVSAGGALITASISASQLKSEDAEGLDNIEFSFVDDHLALIKTTFTGPGDWTGARDFFTRTADIIGLPKTTDPNAITGSGGNEKYRFDCARFTVAMAYSFGVSPSVTLYDPLVQKMVDDRRDQENTRTIRVGPAGSSPVPVRRQPPYR